MRKCAYVECGVEFEAATHNQKYHTAECTRRATNDRIMEDYYAKKARRSGRIRVCTSCNVTVLSRYNDKVVCGKCEASAQANVRNGLLRLLNGS